LRGLRPRTPGGGQAPALRSQAPPAGDKPPRYVLKHPRRGTNKPPRYVLKAGDKPPRYYVLKAGDKPPRYVLKRRVHEAGASGPCAI